MKKEKTSINFSVGDTISIGYDCRTQNDFGSNDINDNFHLGRKAIIANIEEPFASSVVNIVQIRLYFRMKNIHYDLWGSDTWRPRHCRMVLTEKIIMPLQFSGMDLLDYITELKDLSNE